MCPKLDVLNKFPFLSKYFQVVHLSKIFALV